MKLEEAKPLVITAWDVWTAKGGLRHDEATGRDTLQFYCEVLDTKNHRYCTSFQKKREKWRVIHEWIVSERRLGM
jgi:hypothetical protein